MVIAGLLKQVLISGIIAGVAGGIIAGVSTEAGAEEKGKTEITKNTITKNCKILLTSQEQTQKIIVCPNSNTIQVAIEKEAWYLFEEGKSLQEIDGLSTSNESRLFPSDNSKSHWAPKKWRGYRGAVGIQGVQPNFLGKEDFVFNSSTWGEQFHYYGALQTPYLEKCKGDKSSFICSSIELSKETLVLYSRSSINVDEEVPMCIERQNDLSEKWRTCESTLVRT